MSVAALIPVEQYLNTSYSPDCEYVDGAVVERNVGELPHSLVQRKFIVWLSRNCPVLQVWPELRVQVSPSRFRVPDVCVTQSVPGTDVLHTPPLIVLEILSKDDSLSALQERIDDYLAFGVPHVWIVDPRRRVGYACEPSAIRKVAAFEVAHPSIQLPVESLFD